MNLRSHLSQIALVIGAVLLSIGIQTYAFSQPATAPPNGDAYAPINTGSTAQSKVGGLLLNTGAATNGLIVQYGNVGIGTANPAGKLDVSGSICLSGSCISSWASAGGSVTWANVSGKPYPVNGQTWNWSGQGGQPSWLWGSNDGTNMYVWNPANFSVNYASSAGNANTVGGLSSGSFVPRDAWWGSTYYGNNGDIYLGWKSSWLSTVLTGGSLVYSCPAVGSCSTRGANTCAGGLSLSSTCSTWDDSGGNCQLITYNCTSVGRLVP